MVDVHLECVRARSSLRDAGDAKTRDLMQGLFEMELDGAWGARVLSIERRGRRIGVLKQKKV